MNLLIMGPAGSGKGTMSKKVHEQLGIPHISTGDMFRANIANQTAMGMQAQTYINAGKLVPDDITMAMVATRLAEDDCLTGFLLDGYPRTLAQAESLDRWAQSNGRHIDAVLNLNVDFDVLAARVTGRRTCKSCGAIYHIHTSPSKVEGICDNCGGELKQRADDTVEQLRVRLDEYDENTKPVLEYYRQLGLVIDIDASQPVDLVFANIENALGKIR